MRRGRARAARLLARVRISFNGLSPTVLCLPIDLPLLPTAMRNDVEDFLIKVTGLLVTICSGAVGSSSAGAPLLH